MIQLSVNVSDFGRMADVYENVRKQVPQALVRAINWTGDKARTAAGRALSKQTGLNYGKVRKELHTKPATPSDLVYEIGATGGPISLKEFDAQQGKDGVRANPWGVRRLIPHSARNFKVEKRPVVPMI